MNQPFTIQEIVNEAVLDYIAKSTTLMAENKRLQHEIKRLMDDTDWERRVIARLQAALRAALNRIEQFDAAHAGKVKEQNRDIRGQSTW